MADRRRRGHSGRKGLPAWLGWVLLPVIVCAAIAGVELFGGRTLLRLPAEQRTDITLTLPAAPEEPQEAAGELPAEWDESGDEGSGEEWSDETEAAAEDEEEWPDLSEGYPEDESEAAEDDGEEWPDLSEGWQEEDDAAAEGGAGEPAEEVFLDGPASELRLDYTGWAEEVTLHGSAPAAAQYVITYTTPDGGSGTVSSWFTSFLNEDTVHLGKEVTSLTLRQNSAEGLTITGVQVHNSWRLNPERMLLTGLIAACAWILIWFRKWLGQHMAWAFLAVALAAGIFMSVCLPINTGFSFDDQAHANNIFNLCNPRGVAMPASIVLFCDSNWKTIDEEAYVERLDTRRDFEALYREQDQADKQLSDVSNVMPQWEFSYTGYLPQIAGVQLARLLGLGISGQVRLARLFNMLCYVLLTFFALRVLRRFRYVLAAIALAPGALFLSCNFSYDPLGTGLSFLGIALVMDAIMDRETRLTWQRGVGILLCFVLGSLTKTVYIPMILLVLLLPRSKFTSDAARRVYKLMALLLFAAVLLSRVIPTMNDTAIIEDERGNGANSAEQIAFLKAHPFRYLGYFFSFVTSSFDSYFLRFWRTSLAYVGDVDGPVQLLSYLLLLFTAFTAHDDREPASSLTWLQKLAVLFIFGLTVGLTYTTMYVAFSPVGIEDFSGVQARYLLPALPLLFLVFSPDSVKNHLNRTGWTLVFSLLNLLILGWTCWSRILVQYFL